MPSSQSNSYTKSATYGDTVERWRPLALGRKITVALITHSYR
jgi:hypothetical protein